GAVRRDSMLDARGGSGLAQCWIPRLLPHGTRYEGRIHEQPAGPGRELRLPLVLGHDGFTADNLARKGDRNEALLMQALEPTPDRAIAEFLPIVEQAWKRCLEIGDRPDLDGSVAGRGGHLAAHNLAVFYETLGQGALAARYKALAEA